MKLSTVVLGLMSVILSSTAGFSQRKSVEGLKSQIDSLYKVDQQVQLDIINEKVDSLRQGLFQRQIATFKQHKPYLVAIISQYGFPSYSLVGKGASNHFFVLVQHCDDDVSFQKQVLTLMKPEVDKDNADSKGFAYLTDRVLVNSGDLQLYGTQLSYREGKEGKAFIKGVKCVGDLDKRRSAVGLEPIRNYLDKATAMHKAMNSEK